jgi:phosphatidylglycerophosphatase A
MPHSKGALNRIRERLVVFLATGCYAGYVPKLPGTAGSLVAIPLCYLVSKLDPTQATLFVLLFVGLAVWVSGEAEKLFDKKDSGLIVIDEIAGMAVTLFLVPWTVTSVVLGFLFFRIMDIVKPFPIRKLESRLSGGWGVVGDDVLAGIYAHVVLRVVVGLL